jgi:hypothetical protein
LARGPLDRSIAADVPGDVVGVLEEIRLARAAALSTATALFLSGIGGRAFGLVIAAANEGDGKE